MDLPLRAVGAVSSADHVRGVILAMHDRKGNVIVYLMMVLIFLGCWWVFQAESIDASAWMWCIAVAVIFWGLYRYSGWNRIAVWTGVTNEELEGFLRVSSFGPSRGDL
jgi:hypothetical protein